MSMGGRAIDHGTGVLGIVVASHHYRPWDIFRAFGWPMSVGIAPKVTNTWVSSYWTSPTQTTATPGDFRAAITEALAKATPGDVVLLEMQWELTFTNQTVWLLPAEYDYWSYEAIKAGTAAEKVVVEAAGNAGIDFDTDPQARAISIPQLVRDSGYDSGAIIVSAASSAIPHRPLFAVSASGLPAGRQHNYGNRIDCYAWGENIYTITSRENAAITGNMNGTISTFGGTSGASAIVAGAALSLQGMNIANKGIRLSHSEIRQRLSFRGPASLTDPTANTPSNSPATDKIGVMPNLLAIARKLGFADPPPAPPINLDVR